MKPDACCEKALEFFSMRRPVSISWTGVEGREDLRFLKHRRPRKQQKRRPPMMRRPARAPITMPAMAPPLSFFCEFELEPELEPVPEDELPVDVGWTEGMAMTCAEAVSSNTHCETLNVLEL